ncbi:MAG: ribosome-associated translation inhibitor RaiA [Planctomycetes bacterium]|nr:ribosome-associated translation inhibitor RaiA [Planctomycetota bacterium]
MNVSVSARHMELTDAMKNYAIEKVQSLPRFYDGIQSVEITYDKDSGQELVEIIVTGRRKSIFVAKTTGHDMYACLDQCVHKLTEQLRRHKDHVKDRHTRNIHKP